MGSKLVGSGVFSGGVVNIGTGRGISIQETAQAIVDSTQSISRITVLSEDGGSDIVIDISRAEKLLDYHPEVFFPIRNQYRSPISRRR